MWVYDVYTIPIALVEAMPDKVVDRISSISAFSKYLHRNPLGVSPGDSLAFMLVDQEDDVNDDELRGLGFRYEHELSGDCTCCRGTKTGEHEPELMAKEQLN